MSLLSASTTSQSHLAEALFKEGAVNVDLDATVLVQVGIFILLLVILKPLLFDPMLKLFEERERRIEGTRKEAAKEDERSAHALAKYEGILAKAREAGVTERDRLRAEGTRKEAEQMAAVRVATATTIEQARAALRQDAKRLRSELNTESAALAKVMAARVLGREVSS